MSENARVRIAWRARSEPLEPCAVVGLGAVSRALASRIARMNDAARLSLRAVAGNSVFAVLGTRDALPWVDGVTYLGRDPSAPSLLLPCTHAPDVPADLLEAALRDHALHDAHAMPAPWIVLHEPLYVIPVGAARVPALGPLRAWLKANAS